MFAESALRIELHRQGTIQVVEVQADRALVGSGAHCDLRLLPDEASVEQLLIEARDESVYVSARALTPACELNGAPFLEGRLSPDALLELPGVGLRVTLTELKAAEGPKRKSSSETHPAVQGVGLVAVLFGLYYALDQPVAPGSAFAESASPPALFGDAQASCPQHEREAALALAEQEHSDAELKAERAPFYPGDGILAVALYERASACHLLGGMAGEAQEEQALAARLKTTLGDELRIHHVRLERLLEQKKYEESKRELEVLSAFVSDEAQPYARWLSAVKRELALKEGA